MAILAAGLAAAIVMLWLGWWQGQIYHQQGANAALARAAQPTLELAEVAPAGVRPNDAFGRTVSATGTYQPSSQLLIPLPEQPGQYRVLTALVQADGTAVAVIRGVWRGPTSQVPTPPAGRVVQQGLLLPSEPSDTQVLPQGQISSVRISALSQQWPWPLVAGALTVDEVTAQAHGLDWQRPPLPREGGELRNGAYAIQWWLFAGFAVILAGKVARDQGAPLASPHTQGWPS